MFLIILCIGRSEKSWTWKKLTITRIKGKQTKLLTSNVHQVPMFLNGKIFWDAAIESGSSKTPSPRGRYITWKFKSNLIHFLIARSKKSKASLQGAVTLRSKSENIHSTNKVIIIINNKSLNVKLIFSNNKLLNKKNKNVY